MRKQLGVTPTVNSDSVTKSFVRMASDPYGPTDGYTTFPRQAGNISNQTPLVSGRLQMQLIYMEKGFVANFITAYSNTTALATGTNQLFGIFDTNRNLLRSTVNGTNGAWAANSAKKLALTASWTCPESGLYYIGIMVAATTVPSLTGVSASVQAISEIPPITSGSSTTGLTTALPATAAAISGTASGFMAYVSNA